jgi:hypothetical protein
MGLPSSAVYQWGPKPPTSPELAMRTDGKSEDEVGLLRDVIGGTKPESARGITSAWS